MDEPLPDHYKALGVDRNADAATIKATYRKLVLKCHPDKVTDPTLKEQKQDEFHRIQQAYEVLIDDEKKADYEAHLTLEKLRKEKAARGAAAAQREKTARFDVRTTGGASFSANGPSRYATEERKPSKHDDRYFEDRARSKYETYDAYPPKSSAIPRSSREKETASRTTRAPTTDRTRSDREKTRAKDVRSERKFVSVESESSSDDKARYEAEYKKRSADEEARRQAAEAMRKAEERRTYEDNRYVGATAPPVYATSTTAAPAHRKMSAQAEEALRYQHKSRAQVEDEMARPSPVRNPSRDYYATEARSSRREVRPEPVRRSSARPSKERPTMSSRRDTDRGLPEVVEWAEERRSEERRPPMFKTSTSSPAEFARAMPQRSYTETSHHRHAENSPPPSFHRSATSPSLQHSSSRRKDSAVPRHSTLRETMTPSGSPERDAFPVIPPPQTPSGSKTTYYRYPASGGVPIRPEDNVSSANRHTVLREPARTQRSPSPIGKPPIGVNRPAENTTAYKTTAPRPNMGVRTESSRHISPVRGSEDRGRSGRPKLYGEVSGDSRRGGREPSYSPSEVQYSRRYGPEDVRWAPRSGDSDRERAYASKPTLGRTATYVY